MLSSSPLSSSALSLSLSPNTIKKANPRPHRGKEQQTFMAVEATHLNLFPSQLLTNGDLVNSSNQANGYAYNNHMGSAAPFTTTMPENLLPFNHSLVCDSFHLKTSMKADSGLTYNLPPPRKRSRDSMNQLNTLVSPPKNNLLQSSSFLGDNISRHIQQQQLEIDHIVAQHTKKIRLEVEERQKQQARLLVSAIGEGLMRKLLEKDEQIQRMGKLNLALQDRVKSLCVENHLWRDLAQTNEATAISLRTNLEQVLAHVSDERQPSAGFGGGGGGAVADEVESCCGSSNYGRDREEEVVERRMLGVEEVVAGGGNCRDRMCRKCERRESCVLLLPCRHLCLCNLCGSTLHTCPVCNSTMEATVHVSMS